MGQAHLGKNLAIRKERAAAGGNKAATVGRAPAQKQTGDFHPPSVFESKKTRLSRQAVPLVFRWILKPAGFFSGLIGFVLVTALFDVRGRLVDAFGGYQIVAAPETDRIVRGMMGA